MGVFEEAEAFIAQHAAVAVLEQKAGLHIAGLAGDEDHLHIRIGENACERQRTDAVDRARATAAASDEHRFLCRIETKFGTALFP